MITQRDIEISRGALEKLAFAGVVKGLGGAAKAGMNVLRASAKGGDGKIGMTLTGLGTLGLLANFVPFGEKTLGKVPVVGGAANLFDPYSMANPLKNPDMAQRYSFLTKNPEDFLKKVESGDASINRMLTQSRPKNNSYTTKVGSVMFTQDQINQYKRVKSQLEKTAAVSSLRKAVGRSANKGDFARQALAYMAGATALGVAAPVAANMVGEGMNVARRGRLNRDYNEMIKQDPALRREPQARKYFELLHRSSPYVAQEPVIAATVVRNLVESPMLDSRKFKDILDIEKARQETRHPMMRNNSKASIPMPLNFES